MSTSPIVLTLDAGGTNFVFSAMCEGRELVQPLSLPAAGKHLETSLQNMIEGFSRVQALLDRPAAAISFAFPGPADYPGGIIWNVGNLPAYRDGVALGPMLSERFGLPCFINNDGDLYAYGEAIAGLLPQVNKELEQSGSPRRYKNLVGLTIGTGFGAGLVSDGRLFLGDNSVGTEVWLLRHFLDSGLNAEEGVSIRAVQKAYAEQAGGDWTTGPSPKEIFEIGLGRLPGNQAAAVATYERLGRVLGEAVATLCNITDGLVVIGGGLSGAAPLFFPAMLAQLRSPYCMDGKARFGRIVQEVYNLDDPSERAAFLQARHKTIQVPFSERSVTYDAVPKIGIACSSIGTAKAVALGAEAYAVSKLNGK